VKADKNVCAKWGM